MNFWPSIFAKPRNDRAVVLEGAVAEKLDEFFREVLDVVERMGPLRMAADRDPVPSFKLGIDGFFQLVELFFHLEQLFLRPKRIVLVLLFELLDASAALPGSVFHGEGSSCSRGPPESFGFRQDDFMPRQFRLMEILHQFYNGRFGDQNRKELFHVFRGKEDAAVGRLFPEFA